MGWWEDRVLPRVTERTLSAPPVTTLRERVCAGLSGRVLELGFGSGLNLAHLPEAVTALDAVEPADLAWERSERRRRRCRVPVERIGLDGQRVDAPDASYDAALCTFTLCTIPDVAAALSEVRRLLRPGGRLHALEHGLSPDARVSTWQHRLDPAQGFLFGGCHLNRDVPALLTEAGLRVELLEQAYLPGPGVSKPWGYVSLVNAVAA